VGAYVPGAGIEAEEARGLDHAVHTNGENGEGKGHHEARESDVFRTHLSKQRTRHGGTMGKLTAWRNKEKVSTDQGMEALGESKQRSRHGRTRRK
jgi:hypothetical protein